jgi:hypothetical protein
MLGVVVVLSYRANMDEYVADVEGIQIFKRAHPDKQQMMRKSTSSSFKNSKEFMVVL